MPKVDYYSTPEVHPSFKLNGVAYSNEELRIISLSLCENGEVYEQEAGHFLKNWLDDKPYIEAQTSGSTGVPKTLKLYKEQMIHSALATGKFFKTLADSTALLCLSSNYIAGKMMLVRAMVLGWRLDIVPYRSNPLDTLYKRYDFCAMVPLQLDNSLNRLHLIKKLIVGGGSVSEKLQKLVQTIDTKVYETYGMTETVSHIAARRLNPKKKKAGIKAFKALPEIVLATDDRNCLVIKAPKLTPEVLVTNDVVELLTYKKFNWKGRYDHVINSGGIKLHPEVIEKKIQQYISQRFFLIGIADDLLGERLTLIIEGQEVSEEVRNSLLQSLSKDEQFSKFEIPKSLYFLPKFIETPTGKIQRNATLKLANL